MLNTRKYRRLSKEYQLEYAPVAALFAENTLKASLVKNVSGGGVLFGTDEVLPLGSKIVVFIHITGWRHDDGSYIPVQDPASELRLKAIAEIVRVEQDPDQGFFRTGARFVGRVH
jgi:hypothetical protein